MVPQHELTLQLFSSIVNYGVPELVLMSLVVAGAYEPPEGFRPSGGSYAPGSSDSNSENEGLSETSTKSRVTNKKFTKLMH